MNRLAKHKLEQSKKRSWSLLKSIHEELAPTLESRREAESLATKKPEWSAGNWNLGAEYSMGTMSSNLAIENDAFAGVKSRLGK